MKRKAVLSAVAVLIGVTALFAQGHFRIQEVLVGWEEVPVISTDARGELLARISHDEDSIEYQLSYSDMSADVTQAHIHLGQRGVTGGISVWLCSNLASPPTPAPPNDPPACPLRSGTVTGTLTAADVVGPNSQGIAPGELAELVAAIREGKTYANVHSQNFLGGEMRRQIEPGRGEGHH